jgi:hypothetical protein
MGIEELSLLGVRRRFIFFDAGSHTTEIARELVRDAKPYERYSRERSCD